MVQRPSSPALETENVGYWFFRINGCLIINNFLVHHERRGHFGTDVDVLAVRFPFRKELALSEMPMEDHPVFSSHSKIDLIICEIKTGLCALNGPWTKPERKNMNRVLYAVGAFPRELVPEVAKSLYQKQFFEDENYRVRLFAIGTTKNRDLSNSVTQLTWDQILTFIYERFRKYRDAKSQHIQWDITGQRLYKKMENHWTAEEFARDVRGEMNQTG